MKAHEGTVRSTLIAERTVVAIVGPTASGKTALAIDLAKGVGGEIISADSRQVYRHLDIGTAKPTLEERAGIPHHFLDILDPGEEYNAGIFGEQARNTIDALFARGIPPIVVGGSGLYIKSLIDGFFDGPGGDPEFRSAMEKRLKRDGISSLLEELRLVDPVTAGRIDPTKPRRIIRALEVHHITGTPLSTVQELRKPAITYRTIQIGLLLERKHLYERINRRVDEMIERGLINEVAWLKAKGYRRDLNALNTVGYAEVFAHLAGEISEGEMVRLIKRNTRRYAKRQMTWFSADRRVKWFPAESVKTLPLIPEILREREIAQPFGSRT
ncbi:MAG: tRNA (adenosine(37)-N6)-dimethylallyltransferase MiaA [Bacteroidota bacterium]